MQKNIEKLNKGFNSLCVFVQEVYLHILPFYEKTFVQLIEFYHHKQRIIDLYGLIHVPFRSSILFSKNCI